MPMGSGPFTSPFPKKQSRHLPRQPGVTAPLANVTGVTLLTNTMEPKRLGLLRDLAPGASLIGTLVNPTFSPAAPQLQQLEEAARTVGQRIIVAKASDDDALETAFASLVREGAGALLVTAD